MKKNNIFIIIFSITTILLPFLYQYASPFNFLSLGDFLILIMTFIGLFILLFSNKKLNVEMNIIIFSIILTLLSILSSFINPFFSYVDFLTLFFKVIMYNFFLIVASNYFDFAKVKKIYVWLVMFFCIYLFIQYFYTKITGEYLPIYLKYEWLFSWEKRAEDLSYYYNYIYYKFRPSSLFLEPGYFAFYVLPCLIILLIKDNKLMMPIIITLALVLSTSGAGIGIAAIIWLLFFLRKMLTFKNKKILIKLHYFIPGIIVASIIVISLLIFTNLFDRVFGGSFNARILRSFMIFEKVPINSKIFGVGMNNIANFMDFYNITTTLDESNLNNGATISTYLVQFGIIGFISLIIFMSSLLKKYSKNYLLFTLTVYFLIYILFEDVMFNFRMGFILSIIIYYYERYKILNKENKNKNDKAIVENLDDLQGVKANV